MKRSFKRDPRSKYSLLCPLPWDPKDPDKYEKTVANITSLHNLCAQVHGKTVKMIKEALFARIDQRLKAVISAGERSWTAPMTETSRHMMSWNVLAIAATQMTPVRKNGKVLTWLGSVRFLNLVENYSHRQIEIGDDDTDFLSYNQPGDHVSITNYGQTIKKYNSIAAYDSWQNQAKQNPFRDDYDINGKPSNIK